MNTILFIVTVIFIVICIGIYVGFIFSEGKDERGQAIIAKSSQIAFIFVLPDFHSKDYIITLPIRRLNN